MNVGLLDTSCCFLRTISQQLIYATCYELTWFSVGNNSKMFRPRPRPQLQDRNSTAKIRRLHRRIVTNRLPNNGISKLTSNRDYRRPKVIVTKWLIVIICIRIQFISFHMSTICYKTNIVRPRLRPRPAMVWDIDVKSLKKNMFFVFFKFLKMFFVFLISCFLLLLKQKRTKLQICCISHGQRVPKTPFPRQSECFVAVLLTLCDSYWRCFLLEWIL